MVATMMSDNYVKFQSFTLNGFQEKVDLNIWVVLGLTMVNQKNTTDDDDDGQRRIRRL